MGLLHVVEAQVGSLDVAASVAFHTAAFGFAVLDAGPGGEMLLGVPGSPSGRLRIRPVGAPATSAAAADGAPATSAAASDGPPVAAPVVPAVWDLGPRLLGIYSRSLSGTLARLRRAGALTREPVRYPYGTATLHETVARGADGVWWTIPEVGADHRPSPALAGDPDRLHSELHSAVLVVDDHDAAVRFFVDGGGLQPRFDGVLAGEPFERLVGLPTGARLRLTFLVGPGEAPARLEIMSFHGVTGVDRRHEALGLRRLVFAAVDAAATHRALCAAGALAIAADVLRGPAGIELSIVEHIAAEQPRPAPRQGAPG